MNLPGKDPLEENFAAYLRFGLNGQFNIAEKFGNALLKLPGVSQRPMPQETADKILALSERYKDSIDTLVLMISNTPISENAKKVLEVVRQAHRQARMRPERIQSNIQLLAGDPMQQAVAIDRLRESGEYSIPWMLEAFVDPKQSHLQPFIVQALPLVGKNAVNPLVQALSIANPAVQGAVADALGRLGYPQALPYLQRVVEDSKINSAVKDAAQRAINQIATNDPSVTQRPAHELFADLAEQYYADAESLRPDPREPKVNVWYLTDATLVNIPVPPQIFHYIMAMRAARASLDIQRNQPAMDALWVAANFKREAGMGFDVTSEEPVKSEDQTVPADFPRSIYFARTLGPAINQLVLQRGVRDLDPTIALGSIAALNVTAGPAAMVEPASAEGASLAEALNFPDLLVRIRAAIALARAMPQKQFRGSDDVVPALASAVELTGKAFYLVVAEDEKLRTHVEEDLAKTGATVVSSPRFSEALERARQRLTHLDGIFMSTGIAAPGAIDAVSSLKKDARFGLTPIVLIVRPSDAVMADNVAQVDSRVGRVFEVTDGNAAQADLSAQLVARRNEIAKRFGHQDLSPDVSLQLALEAARTLRLIAITRSTVLDLHPAEPSLIAALNQPSEDLRVASAQALAMINSAPAQKAIAAISLGAQQTPTLRKAAFGALADSGRRFGNLLDGTTLSKLVSTVIGEPNLELRTAASQALGALNPPGQPLADVILKYTRS